MELQSEEGINYRLSNGFNSKIGFTKSYKADFYYPSGDGPFQSL